MRSTDGVYDRPTASRPRPRRTKSRRRRTGAVFQSGPQSPAATEWFRPQYPVGRVPGDLTPHTAAYTVPFNPQRLTYGSNEIRPAACSRTSQINIGLFTR